MIRALSLLAVLSVATGSVLGAQARFRSFGLTDDEWCRQDRQADFCEVRQDTLLGLSSVDVTLTRVDGDLRGETVNGGITIELAGSRWTGAGLDVETRNGGITMALPRDYSAQLDIATTNGGLALDFPITVQGNLTRFDRHIVTTLGAGGPRVRAMTTNGGVAIRTR